MSPSVQTGCVGTVIEREVRLAAQRRLARRGEEGGETARMVPKPRVELEGWRNWCWRGGVEDLKHE